MRLGILYLRKDRALIQQEISLGMWCCFDEGPLGPIS